MADASICGLGQAAPNPIRCVMKYFPHEVKSSHDRDDRRTSSQAMPVEFKLNGKDVVAHGGETIIQAAKRHGVEIPHLCYKEGMRPDGNCRACVVEIKGERVLAPSCCRTPAPGMEVTTDSARARALAEDGARAAALRHAGRAPHARLRARPVGGSARRRQAALRARATTRPPIFRTPRSRSISTRASSARAACAPAARSR